MTTQGVNKIFQILNKLKRNITKNYSDLFKKYNGAHDAVIKEIQNKSSLDNLLISTTNDIRSIKAV